MNIEPDSDLRERVRAALPDLDAVMAIIDELRTQRDDAVALVQRCAGSRDWPSHAAVIGELVREIHALEQRLKREPGCRPTDPLPSPFVPAADAFPEDAP